MPSNKLKFAHTSWEGNYIFKIPFILVFKKMTLCFTYKPWYCYLWRCYDDGSIGVSNGIQNVSIQKIGDTKKIAWYFVTDTQLDRIWLFTCLLFWPHFITDVPHGPILHWNNNEGRNYVLRADGPIVECDLICNFNNKETKKSLESFITSREFIVLGGVIVV
jgi:hypothetical protein